MFPVDSRGDKSAYVQNFLITLCRAFYLLFFFIWHICFSFEEYVEFNLTAMACAHAFQFHILREQLKVFQETRYEHFAVGIHHRI